MRNTDCLARNTINVSIMARDLKVCPPLLSPYKFLLGLILAPKFEFILAHKLHALNYKPELNLGSILPLISYLI